MTRQAIIGLRHRRSDYFATPGVDARSRAFRHGAHFDSLRGRPRLDNREAMASHVR